MKEKRRIWNSSKTISSRSLINNYFNIFTSILPNFSFKISNICLTKKIFSSEFIETWKIKKGMYDYCKRNYEPWLHYPALKHSFAQQIAREKFSFYVFLTFILLPRNIQSNFALLLPFKVQRTIASVN